MSKQPFSLEQYQIFTEETITKSVNNMERNARLCYYALGLGGETGEVLEKIKKLFRDMNGAVTPEFREMLKKELGDICWYMTRICTDVNINLEDVFITNQTKLLDRKVRGTLHGDGDNR